MGTYKQFTGSAVVGHLTAAITGTPASFTVDTAVGFPTAGTGQPPFVVCVDRGNASEEKILCSGQGSAIFTIQTRGWDGTAQTNHANGATVEHVIDADSMNDSSQHIHVATRDDHTQYLRVDGTRAGTGSQTIGGALTVSTGGLAVTAGGLTVAAGTTAVQALTSTTIAGTTINGTTITGTGEIQGTDFKATGLTGATAASRHVGATASGAPSSGTFAVGDFIVDQSGAIWACTVAGTPGTWVQVGGATDATWTAVSTFTNSWVNNGPGYFNVAYRKVGSRVYLRGALSNGGTAFGAAFTLPANYRPASQIAPGIVAANHTAGFLTVTSAGVVTPDFPGGTNVIVDLTGVSFDTLS